MERRWHTRLSPRSATPAQQAEAIAEPSVVFIQTEWTGWLMNGPLAELLSPDGESAPSFTVTTTCSGWIANPDGYVVTAGHCVDNSTMAYGGKGLIIQAGVYEAVNQGYLDSADAPALIQYGYANWKVEGKENGSPPDRVVGVYPTKAASGITVQNGIQANVVDFNSFTEGDVALLKVETDTPMPALAVAPATTPRGSMVVAMGYPGSVMDSVDPSATSSMKDGTISGTRTVAGVPFTEISAATSAGMSGGPVVDSQGRVVGTVSWSPGAETQPFNFITATSAVREMLASHSVSNALSATDTTYRAGLTDYFAGRYHAAAKEFDQVLALEPDHAMAQQYLRLATTNFPNEQTGGGVSMLTWVLIGVGAAALLAGGVTGFMLLRRRPGRGPAPAPVGPVPPIATPPVAYPTGWAEAPPAMLPEPPPVRPLEQVPVPSETVEEQPAEVAHLSHYCALCGEPHGPEARFCEACGFHFPERATHQEGSAR